MTWWFWWKTTSELIGKAGSSHKNGSVPIRLPKYLQKLVATLKTTSSLILNKKYNVANLKHYFQEESGDTSLTAIRSSNFWSGAPDEIVRMILLYVLQQSRDSIEKCETYNCIKSTCRKWSKIVEGKGPAFLPRVYIGTWQPIGKSCNGKILVTTRKLTSTFRKSSGLPSQISNCIGDKNVEVLLANLKTWKILLVHYDSDLLENQIQWIV